MIVVKKKSNALTSFIITLGGGVLLGLLALFPNITNATTESIETDIALNVSSIIALSLSNCPDAPDASSASLTLDIYPTPLGKFASNCQNLSITTNAPGYKLTARAKNDTGTNDLLYQNPTDISPKPTIPSTSSPISTPTTLSTDTWGFAVTSTGSPGSGYVDLSTSPMAPFLTSTTYDADDETNLYANLPSTDTTIYQTDELPGQTDEITFYYGANITADVLAGIYSATVTYTAISAEVPDPILPTPTPPPDFITKTSNIVPNFASTAAPTGNGSGTNGTQFSIYASPAVSASPSPPVITIGGQPCTDVTINTARTAMTCTGPVSGMSDGEKRVVINGTDMGDSTTVWYSSYNFPTLQSLTTTGTCLGTIANPVVYRDARDSQLYYVAKMQDNKCWMLDNLRYKPNGDTSGTVTGNFTSTQMANTGLIMTVDGTSTATAPNLDIAYYIDPIASTAGTNYCRTNTNKPDVNISKCGLLYNWTSATAGTAPQSQTTGDASGSICPTNWHLPTGRYAPGDFAALEIAAGGPGAYQNPPLQSQIDLWWPTGTWRGVFTGSYGNSFYDQGSDGYYWSSSVSSATDGYSLFFSPTFVYPGIGGLYRYVGYAVRCVL